MKLNKKIAAAGGLAAIAVIGGTWAYFNQTTAISNPLGTGTYTTSMVERFTPESDWQPGVKVDKLVQAENTGDYPVLVRVKMDETWTRKGENVAFASIMSVNNKAFNDLTEKSVENSIVYLAKQFNTITSAFDESADKDGNVPAFSKVEVDSDFSDKDHSVVYKNLTGLNAGWAFNDRDGYWYYGSLLGSGTADRPTVTSPLMDAIMLAANVDMGKYTDGTALDYVVSSSSDKNGITEEWIVSEKTSLNEVYDSLGAEDKKAIDEGSKYLWSRATSKIDNSLAGYANANYALNITTEFIQATADAVNTEWASAPDNIKNLVK